MQKNSTKRPQTGTRDSHDTARSTDQMAEESERLMAQLPGDCDSVGLWPVLSDTSALVEEDLLTSCVVQASLSELPLISGTGTHVFWTVRTPSHRCLKSPAHFLKFSV